MSLEGIVNKGGALLESFQELDPNTLQHSDEITNDRRDAKDYKDLRRTWFYTADYALYRIEHGEAILYLGRRETNPIFKNIEEATKQLRGTDNYIPKKQDIEAVIKAESTLRIKLSDLKLRRFSREISYFEIDTSDYGKLNDVQREFAERVYGSMEVKIDEKTGEEYTDFERNMKMFKENKIRAARVYVLTPGYVEDKVKKHSAIARLCSMSIFIYNSDFRAYDRVVHGTQNQLRGVPLSA